MVGGDAAIIPNVTQDVGGTGDMAHTIQGSGHTDLTFRPDRSQMLSLT